MHDLNSSVASRSLFLDMPQMHKIMTMLSDILQDDAKRKGLFKLRGYHAQCLIDFLDYFLSDPELRSTIESSLLNASMVALGRLCEISLLHPTRYVLSGIRNVSMKFAGGPCDIFQGHYDRQRLCLKVVRKDRKQDQDNLSRVLAREAILWSKLDHPNVVPFYGFFYLEQRERISLVSPWMKNRDIMAYFLRAPEAPRKPFIHDIINGLQYLHAANIVHGDFTVRKVLVNEHQHACLADFGLSTIVMEGALKFMVRWTSPERLKKNTPPTRESDVWAFGCVSYQVLTERKPFAGCSDFEAVSKLLEGEIPARLDTATFDENKDINKKLRELVKKCWLIEPEQRPSCSEIQREIENIPIVRAPHDLNRITTRNPSRPGFRLMAPGSTFSTNLNRGQKILEALYQGNEAVGFSDTQGYKTKQRPPGLHQTLV